MKRIKSTATLGKQEARIWELLREVTKSQISRVHPETGGSIHLAGNWGNPQAKQIVDRFYDKQIAIHAHLKKKYDMAFAVEYPEHMLSEAYVEQHGEFGQIEII